MTYNPDEISSEKLFLLLDSISKYVDIEINLYALGGTALTLLGIKKSTLDVDINIEKNKDYDYICNLFKELGFEKKGAIRWISQEGIAFDIFHGSYILGTELLSDCLKLASPIRSFGKINLFTLSLEDIIISKLSRGDNRDFDDIKLIFNKNSFNLQNLIKRYKLTMENSIVSQSKQKLLDLIEIKFKQWNIPIDEQILNEVKKWEPK
ncbi:MAG: DUF6036 family nucleotidyltransferase [archaeon]